MNAFSDFQPGNRRDKRSCPGIDKDALRINFGHLAAIRNLHGMLVFKRCESVQHFDIFIACHFVVIYLIQLGNQCFFLYNGIFIVFRITLSAEASSIRSGRQELRGNTAHIDTGSAVHQRGFFHQNGFFTLISKIICKSLSRLTESDNQVFYFFICHVLLL